MLACASASLLRILGTAVDMGAAGSAYSFQTSAIGGVRPLTYSLIGEWPLGLSVDSADGLVSGFPHAGTYPDLTVRVTDGRGVHADLPSFTLTVSGGPYFPIGYFGGSYFGRYA